jgi:hypothetical protein
MARRMIDIRDDIEATVRRRADVYRRQADSGTPELADVRCGLDAELRLLWGELREARADSWTLLRDFTPQDARILIRSNPRLVLA